MEFLRTQSRYGSQNSSMRKKVGLLIFNETPFKEAHIVFCTRDLTKSITKNNNTPSSKHNQTPITDPTVEILSPTSPLETPCLLSSHGLRRGSSGSLKHTLHLLPQTVCTTHGATAFLPLDYVKRMAEYTRTTTYGRPTLKVVHSFDDCILEFPIPPPIGSSEELECSDLDYSRNCYQCFTELCSRRTVYMYRDYLFCCHGCRLRACATTYWYKKLMEFDDDDDDDGDDKNNNVGRDDVNGGANAMDETEIFDIVS